MFLPGGVLPAELAYSSLVEVLGGDADAVAKDLEVYATDEPPQDYTLDLEVAGVLREADRRGWEPIPPRRLLRGRGGRARVHRSPS